jgi:predicted dehydrogenase
VDAFAAGTHVLCEKPMASTTEYAQKMIDAWKKSGKQFTIGYQNRFRAEVQALYKSCTQGELGEIYFAKAHAIRRRAVPTWGCSPTRRCREAGR